MYSRVGFEEITTEGCCDGGTVRENGGKVVASGSTMVGCDVTADDGRAVAACEDLAAETIGDAESRVDSEDGSIERFAAIENDGGLVSFETMAVSCDGNSVVAEEATALGV